MTKHTAARGEHMWPADNGFPLPPWMPAKARDLFPIRGTTVGKTTTIRMNVVAFSLNERLMEKYGNPNLTLIWGPGKFYSDDDPIEYAPSTKPGVVFVRVRPR